MKKIISFLLILTLILSLAACGGTEPAENEEPAESEEPVESEEPKENEDTAEDSKYGGEITITDLSFNDAKTLDPHLASAAGSMRHIENMYNGLLQYKQGTYGEIEGELAKDYNISEDGLTYTFNLHEGVKFHNGDDLTSEDVKYSIERIIDMEIRASNFAAVESIETPDDTTVVIKLKEPVAPFATFLAYPMNVVVNKNVVEANGGSLDNIDAGSGPFMLEEWKKDQHFIMTKFDNYFEEGLPYLDKVILQPVSEETARNTSLRNKESDMILQISPKDVMSLQNEEDIIVKSVPGTYWEYLGMNMSDGPLTEKKVRQAISYGIDREELNQVVKFGQATPLSGGPIPPGHWAYADLGIHEERNIEKAQSLLEEAGYGDGFTISLITLPNEIAVNAAQVVKQQLADLNITVEVNSIESSVYFERLGSDDFELTIIGWVGFVDPDEFLYNIFTTDGVWNQHAYSNERVDELLEEGRVTSDREERKEIYYEAQKLIVEDAPMAFLYVNKQISAYQDYVKGFDVNATVTTKSLKNTWLDK
jgi:peptide/nickel transport system substrate-binding protein